MQMRSPRARSQEVSTYLVLLAPDDLRRRFDLAHVLLEGVPGLLIHDF